jgi:Uncharacterised protein family UPF0547
MYVCPQCDTEINTATEICPHCGFEIPAAGQSAEPEPPKPTRVLIMRWAIIIAIVAGGLWGFLWYVMPSPQSDPAQQAEFRAASALLNLRTSLAAYAAAQPGNGFPNSLEPLGDQARAEAQLAQSEGYTIQYTPGPPGPDGGIHSYSLQARAGNFGYRSFYLDESGLLRATREDRTATAHDPPLEQR